MDEENYSGWFEERFGKSEDDYPVRREYRRIVFRKFMGVYTYLEDRKLTEVEILNISPKGCAFKLGKDDAVFERGDHVAFRFYFTLNTYLPARLEIRNVRPHYEGGVEYRVYGAEFDRSLEEYECLRHFIENIYLYAEQCRQDNRGSVFDP